MKNLIAGYFLLFFCASLKHNHSMIQPHFLRRQPIPYGANLFRQARVSRGPNYWQNKADYKITASLDEI
jgi:hypothetical protein